MMEDGTVYRAKMFIDASYEGDFMAMAGVSFTFGCEGTNIYGELPINAPVVLAPGLVVSDPSSSLLAGATVTIAGGVLPVVTNGIAISASYNSATEKLTLSGSDSMADYQQVLRSLTFNSTNADPSHGGTNGVRILAWTITDGLLVSAKGTSTVAIVAPGAPPFGRIAIQDSTNGLTLLFTGNAS
jgi:hypothetical protein